MWEMAKICRKFRKYLTIGLNMWEMSQRFGKWLKYLGNGLDLWDTAEVFENRHKYVENYLTSEIQLTCVVNGLSILETALLCLKWLKNLTIFLKMWEMTYVSGKWLKYLRNG